MRCVKLSFVSGLELIKLKAVRWRGLTLFFILALRVIILTFATCHHRDICRVICFYEFGLEQIQQIA